MSRRKKLSAAEQRRRDRTALVQWAGIGFLVIVALAAALVLADGDGGSELNAPPLPETTTAG